MPAGAVHVRRGPGARYVDMGPLGCWESQPAGLLLLLLLLLSLFLQKYFPFFSFLTISPFLFFHFYFIFSGLLTFVVVQQQQEKQQSFFGGMIIFFLSFLPFVVVCRDPHTHGPSITQQISRTSSHRNRSSALLLLQLLLLGLLFSFSHPAQYIAIGASQLAAAHTYTYIHDRPVHTLFCCFPWPMGWPFFDLPVSLCFADCFS